MSVLVPLICSVLGATSDGVGLLGDAGCEEGGVRL